MKLIFLYSALPGGGSKDSKKSEIEKQKVMTKTNELKFLCVGIAFWNNFNYQFSLFMIL
jgi:hypothetical protein